MSVTVIIYYTSSSLFLSVSDDVAITEQTNFIEKNIWIIPIRSGQMAPTRGGGRGRKRRLQMKVQMRGLYAYCLKYVNYNIL
jgi:hypothetical protein